jgi:hypothetical protein
MPADGGLQAGRCRGVTRIYESHTSGANTGAAIPSNNGRMPRIMEDGEGRLHQARRLEELSSCLASDKRISVWSLQGVQVCAY